MQRGGASVLQEDTPRKLTRGSRLIHMPGTWIALLLISISSAASVDPDVAKARLCEGNARVVSGKATCPRQSDAVRATLATTQKPFAVVVSCSDSRVPPELIFDQGLGDLFVIRVAGEVLDGPALGSVEYGVAHLGARLVVVLGHERCGAVQAAMGEGHASPNLEALIAPIKPAVDSVADKKGDKLDLAVRANVARVVRQIREAIALEGFEVTGMYYDLDTAKVENLP
jgi:carbonic anhydrase